MVISIIFYVVHFSSLRMRHITEFLQTRKGLTHKNSETYSMNNAWTNPSQMMSQNWEGTRHELPTIFMPEAISKCHLLTKEKLVLLMETQWVYKPLLRAGPMPSSKRTTQNQLSGIFVSIMLCLGSIYLFVCLFVAAVPFLKFVSWDRVSLCWLSWNSVCSLKLTEIYLPLLLEYWD